MMRRPPHDSFLVRTMRQRRALSCTLALSLLCAWFACVDCAHASTDSRSSTIANVPVRTQTDQPLRFYDDLVKHRIVAINFVFTSCSSVCPLMGARFAQTQKLLGESTDDVSLISISIDPATDTPDRLKMWGEKMHAAPGWTLVTGAKPDIDTLVRSLRATTVDPSSHAPLTIVIDDKHGGPWQRLDGLTNPAVLARILREHAAQK